MTLRQPRWIPPARRHAHTSPSSSDHNAGNFCHVVVAGTTAVGRPATTASLTSYRSGEDISLGPSRNVARGSSHRLA